MRGWQVGAVGACVVGVMALFGQAAWAQVVTPQPWPGVVGQPIMVGGPQRPGVATNPDQQAVGALDPTAAATSTVLTTESGSTPAGAEPTAASTSDVAGAPAHAPAEQPTSAPQNPGSARTTATSAPRVVTPDRVREVDDDKDEDTSEAKSATSTHTDDSHESDKDDD